MKWCLPIGNVTIMTGRFEPYQKKFFLSSLAAMSLYEYVSSLRTYELKGQNGRKSRNKNEPLREDTHKKKCFFFCSDH